MAHVLAKKWGGHGRPYAAAYVICYRSTAATSSTLTAYQNANVLSGHDKRLIDSFTNTRQETDDKKMNKINNNNLPPCPAGLL